MMNDMGVRLGVPLQESRRESCKQQRLRVSGRTQYSTSSDCDLRTVVRWPRWWAQRPDAADLPDFACRARPQRRNKPGVEIIREDCCRRGTTLRGGSLGPPCKVMRGVWQRGGLRL